jgi:hypothetical protein
LRGRRTWNVRRYQEPVGDEEAMIAATALANIAGAETIRSLIDTISFVDRIGGEVKIAAYRDRFDLEGNRIGHHDETPGTYQTYGYLFTWTPEPKSTQRATQSPIEDDHNLNTHMPLIEEVEAASPTPEDEPEQIAEEATPEPVPG